MSLSYDGTGKGSTATGAAGAPATSSAGAWDQIDIGAQGKWVDIKGGIWRADTDLFRANPDSATGYADSFLMRPAGEDATDQAIFSYYPVGADNTVQTGSVLRYNHTTKTHYLADWGRGGGGILSIYRVDAGGIPTLLTNTVYAFSFVKTYLLAFSAIGTSPTTLTIDVFENGSGTSSVTLTTTDSTVAQQSAGGSGLSSWQGPLWGGGHGVWTRVATATAASPLPPPFSPPPPDEDARFTATADLAVALVGVLSYAFAASADLSVVYQAPLDYRFGARWDGFSTGGIATPVAADFDYRFTATADLRVLGGASELTVYRFEALADLRVEVDGVRAYTFEAAGSLRTRVLLDGRLDLLAADVYRR